MEKGEYMPMVTIGIIALCLFGGLSMHHWEVRTMPTTLPTKEERPREKWSPWGLLWLIPLGLGIWWAVLQYRSSLPLF